MTRMCPFDAEQALPDKTVVSKKRNKALEKAKRVSKNGKKKGNV